MKLSSWQKFLNALAVVAILSSTSLMAAEAGDSSIDLTLPRLDQQGGAQSMQSETVSLGDYQGKIIYLDFWASWCPPCLVSMPIMNEMRNRLQSQGIPFEVIAINVDSDAEDGLDFLLDKPVDFIVLTDPEGETPALYEIKGMPTSFLISAAGLIELKHEGFKQSDAVMIEQEIMRLSEQMP